MKHTKSERCACKPVMVFQCGDRYGKIILHATEGGEYTYPNINQVISAIKQALKGKEVHIVTGNEEI